MTHLIDAAGNLIPTNRCRCGRPKLATEALCCDGCPGQMIGVHSSACHMRCATMGVPGFGVRFTDAPVREVRIRR